MLNKGSIFQERYEILDRLGEGGMGAVYKAMQLDANSIVALKLMHNFVTTTGMISKKHQVAE